MRTRLSLALIQRAFASVLALAAAIFLIGIFGSSTASAQANHGPDKVTIIVKMAPGLSENEHAATIARNGGTEKARVDRLSMRIIEVPANAADAILKKYQDDAKVTRAEKSQQRQTDRAPVDPLFGSQWALPKIGWDLVFGNMTPTGTATVAVLDTGVNAAHPDLAGNVIAGTSILDGSSGMTDANGHGTWVAGIVAARSDNGEGIAGVGFAGVRVMPVTVLNADGLGEDADVVQGVVWAADNGANVILMAFSNPGFSESLQEAIDYAWARGVVLVAAAGNDGWSTPSFPAGDRGVVGVAATDEQDLPAVFSNEGQSVFLAAPGTNIQTTDKVGYTNLTGTSSSAAYVAGAAALLKAFDPSLSNGIIVGRLARTADSAGSQGDTGNGRLNLARALSDTGTDPIQPVGADPVGQGGPFVGPYVAAATLNINIGPQQFLMFHGAAGTATYTVSFNITGNSTPISFTAQVSGVPAGATFSLVPSTFTSVTPSTSPTPTAQLTIQTTAGNTIPAGSYPITVSAPALNKSDSEPLLINQAGTNLAVSVTSPQDVGASFPVTATVTSFGGATPTGSITISAGGPNLCNVSLSPVPPPPNPPLSATATCNLSFATAGTKSLFIEYGGNTNYASNSTFTNVQINNVTYTVTPVAGANGSISPNTAQTVIQGATTSFTVTPTSGYHINTVTGCNGTLSTNTYTTGAVNANCTVNATFAVNPPPTLTINQNVPLVKNEGQNAGVTGKWEDAYTTNVTVTASIGTINQTGNGNWQWSFNTTDGPAQSQTVTITADNGAPGGITTKTFELVVENVNPTATITADTLTPDEGGSVIVSLTNPVDPSPVDTTAGFHYAFACNNGSLAAATYANSGTSNSFSCSYLDNGSQTVRARIIDKDGGFTEYTIGITVNNLAPTATFTVEATEDQGQQVSVTFSNPVDAAGDVAAGLRYGYACTGGQAALPATYGASSTSPTSTCTYNQPGTFTIWGRVIDKDGAFSDYFASTVISAHADLVVTKTDGKAIAIIGDVVTYTIVVANNGPDAVTGVGVVDNLPSTLSGITWSCATTLGSSCSVPLGTSNINNTVDLAVGGSATFVVSGTLSLTATGTLTNTVSLTLPANVIDDNLTNNEAIDVDQIKKKTQSIVTVSAPATATYGSPIANAVASGGDGTGAYVYSHGSSTACTVHASTGAITIVTGTGSCAITAHRPGDSLYEDSAESAGAVVDVKRAEPTVTAIGNTCVYSAGPCNGGGTATGVNNESLTPVTLEYRTLADMLLPGAPVNAGTYKVIAKFAGNANYLPTDSTAATITITPKPASVTPNPAGKIYGNADPLLSGTLSGFIPSDGVTALYSRTGSENVGIYVISVALTPVAVLSNYAITYNTAAFEITPRPITVTANNITKFLTVPVTPDPPLTYTIGGLGLASSDEGVLPTGGLSRAPGETADPITGVSSYAIGIGTLAFSSNYQVTFNGAALHIVSILVTANTTDPVAKGNPSTLTVKVKDTGTQAGPSCSINWDDGLAISGPTAMTSTDGYWTCVITRTLANAGVYSPIVTVVDANTGTASVTYQYIVVYDATGGFVTGGGWINSPLGAYVPNKTLTGKANFGFVSKYQKGANVPTGETEFQFKVADLNFKSTVYEWLVVSGAKAQYKGSGTINGGGNYGFLLTATDGQVGGGGGVDKFRIKIIDKTSNTLVYDNVPGAGDDVDVANPQALGGGSITVHK